MNKDTRSIVAAAVLAALSTLTTCAATRYVWQGSPSPGPPYDTWANAAHDIQTAVDAAVVGDEIVVTNGIYATGGRAVGANVLVNRAAADKPLTLRSVNGPEVTVIDGGGSVRCVYLGDGASLSGFTVTNGFVSMGDGGGLYCESATVLVSNCTLTGNGSWNDGGGACGGTLYNCTLTANSAEGDGGGAYLSTLNDCVLTGNWACGLCSFGGGACECTLCNCTLIGNSAPCGWGGGAYGGTLNNCTLVGNSAYEGGGAYGPYDGLCTLNNCTLIGNSARHGAGGAGGGSWLGTCIVLNNCIVHYNDNGNYDFCCTLNYCCTVPMPWRGLGNLTNAPLFVNTNHWSDLRLQPNSPCIDAGTNLTGLISTDILGLPRPMDGNNDGLARFDIGAHEFNPYRFAPTLQLSARGFLFTVCGEPGRSVQIERSRDLVNWEFAGQVPIPVGGQTLIDPAATTEPRLFYRAMRVP